VTGSLLGPRLAALAVIGLGGVVLLGTTWIAQAGGYSAVGPTAFPLAVGIALVALGGLFLVRTTLRPDSGLAERVAAEERATHWPTPILLGATLIGYAVALGTLGYILATAVFVPLGARIMASDHLRRDVIVGIALAIIVYVGFTQVLGVRLPAGLLEPILP
jgi:putative tricarboxylic transport membrane protein